MSASKIRFYQSPKDHHLIGSEEAEVCIGDLTLMVCRHNHSSYGYGPVSRLNEHVSIRVQAFTDTMNVWRRLDKMRVFHKIERAKLKDSDDLARLLVNCGLKHVPYPGAPYEEDPGAEARRIKELHS